MSTHWFGPRGQIVAEQRYNPRSRFATHGMRDIVDWLLAALAPTAISFCLSDNVIYRLYRDRDNSHYVQHAGGYVDVPTFCYEQMELLGVKPSRRPRTFGLEVTYAFTHLDTNPAAKPWKIFVYDGELFEGDYVPSISITQQWRSERLLRPRSRKFVSSGSIFQFPADATTIRFDFAGRMLTLTNGLVTYN